jgi:ankyrin repeat protein
MSPSHANAVGQSALHIACLWGNISAVQMLLQHDADVQAQNRIMGSSPLHCCINSSKEPFENRLSCAKLLVDHGADVHLKDLYGMTPLDYLDKGRHTGKGEVDVIKLLAMKDVLESSDMQVLNLIPFLERNDLQGLVALLLEEDGGDDVNVQERDPKTGKTALMLAIEEITKHEPSLSTQKGQDQERTEILVSIVTLLLQKGADANAIPKKNIDDTVLKETLAPMYMICKALDAEYRYAHASFKIRMPNLQLHLYTCIFYNHCAMNRTNSTDFELLYPSHPNG